MKHRFKLSEVMHGTIACIVFVAIIGIAIVACDIISRLV